MFGNDTIYMDRSSRDFYSFDSRKHPGCTIYAAGKKVDWIVFTIKEITHNTYKSVGAYTSHTYVTYEINGKMADVSALPQKEMFVINIYGYSPMSENDYIFTITGCFVEEGSGFSGRGFEPWRVCEPIKELADGRYVVKKL